VVARKAEATIHSCKPRRDRFGDIDVAERGALGLASGVFRAVTAAGGLLLAGLFGIPIAFAPGDLPPAAATGSAGVSSVALAAYQRAAATCSGLRWELMAGIGQVESGHGTSGGSVIGPDGVAVPPILGPPLDGSGAGGNTTPMPAGVWAGRWGVTGPWLQAVGPMQFLPPTFDAWAADGDGDGITDPQDIDDAAATAAAYLCGPSGELTDERAALRRYNASDAYVEDVLAWAARYAAASPLVVDQADAAALLDHPNVTIYADGRADLSAGRVDGRVVAVLLALARDHTITVTSLVTGHPRCAVTGQAHRPGCTVSNHYLGRGADIAVLDGVAISAGHPSVVDVMDQLAALPEPFRPDEIGGPIDTGQPGVFTNTFHADHIHVGWDS
jgi:hypothetical protein